MTTLTEEGHCLTDLSDELNLRRRDIDDDDVYEEEIVLLNWIKWVPDPVDANPC